MAQISRRPFLSHLRASATSHIIWMKRGKVKRSGRGLAFWFRPLTAALSEVPVDNREIPLIFHTRTADFQDAAVQATVSFRVVAPERAAERVDFGIHPASGVWTADPLNALAQLVTETAQQHAAAVLASLKLTDALTAGIAATRDAVAAGLGADERLADTGIEVVGVRVLAITPEAEVERALQTPTREAVQQEADKATYERRALAVESERAISQNEMQSRIELAVREQELLEREGANARKRAEDEAAAEAIRTDQAVAAQRARGEAVADAEKAMIAAQAKADPQVLLARAAGHAAANLRNLQNLTITPDLLSKFLGGQDKSTK